MAVYYQPVPMVPKAGGAPSETDIHLECDVNATKGNKLGFGLGEFVPYLSIRYRFDKEGSQEVIEGNLMPMNAVDGAHYGNNVKLHGAGNYRLTYIIESPEKQGYVLHIDDTTGVPGRFWKKPIVLTWDFPFLGRKWE